MPNLTVEHQLRQALEHLAAAPEAQAAYLRQLGTSASLDELALSFDDVAEASAFSTAAAIQKLSRTLDEMSGADNAHLWKPSALRGPEWAEVRRLAQDALLAIASN